MPIIRRFDSIRLHRRRALHHPQGRHGPAARSSRTSTTSCSTACAATPGRKASPRPWRDDPRVKSYVKNERLGFTIPYVHEGRTHEYVPDFLVRLVTEPDDVERTLIIEVSGSRKSPGPTAAKADTARNQWCAAVNNWGEFGRWGYVEVHNPADAGPLLDDAIDNLYADRPDHRAARLITRNAACQHGRARRNAPTPVDAITHADKRANLPTADRVPRTSSPRRLEQPMPVRYPRDPTLDPQLVWKGKDELDSEDLVADAPPIYIQEKIDPRVIIENLRRTAERPEDEPELTLFDDLRRPRRAGPRRLLPPRGQLVQPDDPRRLPQRHGQPRRARRRCAARSR